MQDNKIRSFIAIGLPPEIRQNIAVVISTLSKTLTSKYVRWVEINNVHLTLRFLGEVPQRKLSELIPNLQSISNRLPQYQVNVSGFGVFPNFQRARVLWIGINTSPNLLPFITELENVLGNMGIPRENREFSPHLTIGRIKRSVTTPVLISLGKSISTIKVGNLGNFQVKSINLYSSELTDAGPIYTCVASLPIP